MYWIIIAILFIPPVFELDRFTRRDIRQYNRVIRKIERKNNSYFRKNKELPEDLPFSKDWYCKLQ
jgi:hypothetical protein